MKEKQQQRAIQNFLGSLDFDLDMYDHFRNALRDSELYRWDSDTVVEIFKGIEDAYKKKGKR